MFVYFIFFSNYDEIPKAIIFVMYRCRARNPSPSLIDVFYRHVLSLILRMFRKCPDYGLLWCYHCTFYNCMNKSHLGHLSSKILIPTPTSKCQKWTKKLGLSPLVINIVWSFLINFSKLFTPGLFLAQVLMMKNQSKTGFQQFFQKKNLEISVPRDHPLDRFFVL